MAASCGSLSYELKNPLWTTKSGWWLELGSQIANHDVDGLRVLNQLVRSDMGFNRTGLCQRRLSDSSQQYCNAIIITVWLSDNRYRFNSTVQGLKSPSLRHNRVDVLIAIHAVEVRFTRAPEIATFDSWAAHRKAQLQRGICYLPADPEQEFATFQQIQLHDFSEES
ncbi:hypothetical protein K440DRAFT_646018 [Wilcoxina mikolae CBS 423.85]|nr:hypothetical protein K440DRAFT_646018 [Wilcoxina mikolae CBS 423.85]